MPKTASHPSTNVRMKAVRQKQEDSSNEGETTETEDSDSNDGNFLLHTACS
jgi:hypothetical protein